MTPVKLVVTNKSQLQFKYGKTNFSKINSLLNELKKADSKRGLNTMIVYIDDTDSAKKAGIKKISFNSEKECKRAVDDLYKKHIPAYIMILGSEDIVPFQKIVNPTNDEDQPDVPSD